MDPEQSQPDRQPSTLDSVAARKIALRDRLVTVRGRRPLVEVSEAARALAEHLLAAPEVQRAATVAAYVSVGTEPGTGPLLDRLVALGRRVVLPVVLPDLDLDWAVYDGPDSLVRARRGLLEPRGPRLGPEAVATADAVLTPGLAVDHDGRRLGQGGGCYDRALSRVPVGTFVCTLLYDDELVDEVPAAEHDRPVTAAVTPSGLTRLRRA
ncbi:MAG TPA: 5-formyltetrahydrofolate cyclo-ligase [Nocardioidaceae bacterium]|nr:5-formyltetrahydrofolate cyclo-ligase [Nocardioidaceae bacterium]